MRSVTAFRLPSVAVALCCAATATVLAAGLQRAGALSGLDMKGFDVLATTAGLAPLPPEIVVVDIDNAAAKVWGIPVVPRDRWAAVVRRVAEGAPDLIGLDYLMSEPRTAEQDQALEDALRAAGNVVLVGNFESVCV